MSKVIYSLFLLSVVIGCTDGFGGGGSNSLIKQLPSPDGTSKALFFRRTGGATVGDSYRISIVSTGDTLEQADLGNTFVFDDNHGEARLSFDSMAIRWKSGDTLEISYSDKLRTFAQQKKVGNVAVVYKKF
jgi:hypothetical protein